MFLIGWYFLLNASQICIYPYRNTHCTLTHSPGESGSSSELQQRFSNWGHRLLALTCRSPSARHREGPSVHSFFFHESEEKGRVRRRQRDSQPRQGPHAMILDLSWPDHSTHVSQACKREVPGCESGPWSCESSCVIAMLPPGPDIHILGDTQDMLMPADHRANVGEPET